MIITRLRVELEILDELPVVHNYGHCGSVVFHLHFGQSAVIWLSGMEWWPPQQPLKMPWLSSRTGSMLPEDVFELFWMIRCMKKMKVTIMLPIGLDGDDDDDEAIEDICCTNWIWWGDVLPARSRDLAVDSVLHQLEVIDKRCQCQSCSSHWFWSGWSSFNNIDILNTVLIVSESYVVLNEPRCLFFYLILRVL